MTEETKVCKSLDEALEYLADGRKKTEEQINKYRHNVKEMTGFFPDEKLGPMEVVAVVKKVFGGIGGDQIKTN
jgi:hypothetical protein